MAKSSVSVVRCADYDPARVRRAVEEALSLLPGLPRVSRDSGKRVLLKPNLLSSRDPPERAVNTHPEFVRAVGESFVARGWRVLIGDSCGSMEPGSTSDAIRTTGLDRVAREISAEIVDFDRAPSVEAPIPQGRVLCAVKTPRLLSEVDLFVTLPKLKTHGLTLYTGAVKNQLGLVPGNGKKEIHLLAPKPERMAEALLDIHSLVRPRLAVMDGIVAMEGNGPAAGRPRAVGLVIASADAVSLDAVAAEIIGYERGEVDTTRLGHERGLGIGRIEEIEVSGVPLGEAAVPDFKKPPRKVRSGLFKLMPDSLLRWVIDNAGATYAQVMDDRCVLCGECVANCPAKAFKKVGGRIRADRRLCISCYCCSEVCRQRAIAMRRPLAGRALRLLARLARGAS
jgi:uncharacterized protein (DUF362 family)/Pyruvate/2-oxoacid:ferredoxin oxidoreductase delta subunit